MYSTACNRKPLCSGLNKQIVSIFLHTHTHERKEKKKENQRNKTGTWLLKGSKKSKPVSLQFSLPFPQGDKKTAAAPDIMF